MTSFTVKKDIRYANGKIITNPFTRAKRDWFIRLYKKDKEEALWNVDQIIKKTYHTLMTTWTKGCYIYCVHPALKGYLSHRIKIKCNFIVTDTLGYIPIAEQVVNIIVKPAQTR